MNFLRTYLVVLIFIAAFSKGSASPDWVGSLIPRYSAGRGEAKKMEIKLKLLQATADRWDFEVTMQNAGNQPMFVMTSPTSVEGVKGWYVSLAEKDSSVLEISSRFYPPPPYFLYANDAGVELRQLSPKAIHTERVSIKLPMKETMPPYGAKSDRAAINYRNIKLVRAVVGLLPDEEGIKGVLERKPAAPFVNGFEEIMKGSFKGKHLIDLQTVACSEMLNL